MANSGNLQRHTWLIDTLRRHGRLTRAEINEKWRECELSGGSPLTRRTFYNDRAAISRIFGIEVEFDHTTNEYFIAGDAADATPGGTQSVTDWLVNANAMRGVLADAHSISSRIFMEQVPSARHNLAPIIAAIKENRVIRFTYNSFSRSRPTGGILLEPYLVKLFRQRWYVAGRNVKEDKLKTYALDRIERAELTDRPFVMPADFVPADYFRYSFGIVVDSSQPRRVQIKADARQAKYLRALPLHPSQDEMVHNGYSIFTYNLLLTPDFLQELMALGPFVEVLAPQELKTMLVDRLSTTLALYS